MPRLLLAALCGLFAPSFVVAEPVSTAGKVTAVTVYQGQALVTREVEVASEGGLTEVVVTDLPAQVTAGSLYAEPLGDVEIRSVRYRVRPVAEDTRAEVRELDEQIQAVRDEIAEVQAQNELLSSQAGYLNKLEEFTTQTASKELTNGVLDATTLKELTKTIFDGRAEVAEGQLAANKTTRELNERIGLLMKQRQTLTNSSSRSQREAVVFVNAPQKGSAKLRLTYLVSGATWSPSYNLRASDQRDKVHVEYNASIQQLSGEDWTEVEMTLSTASPSLVATAPSLDPLAIRLGAAPPTAVPQSGPQGYVQTRQQLAQQQKSLSKSRRSFAANAPASQTATPFTAEESSVRDGLFESEASGPFAGRSGGMGGGGGFGASYGDVASMVERSDIELNMLCAQVQILDFNSTAKAPAPTKATSPDAQGISVVYKLAGRTSLPSRADQQLIPIAALPLEGEFYRVARPALTEYVYEEALVTNDTDVVLLAGPAATFLGDRFVGRGAVPTVSVGEPFTVGLGIDESLRASRELVEKDRRLQGGNRVAKFAYRLTLENFGDAPTKVRLYDRLPTADDAEIKVSLLESKPEPTPGDAKERKQGLLRWDLEAPAKDGAAGSVTVNYTMQLEYDKQREIVEAPAKR